MKLRYFTTYNAKPTKDEFREITLDDLRAFAEQTVEGEPDSDVPKLEVNELLNRLDAGAMNRHSAQNPVDWSADATALDCGGFAWAIRTAQRGKRVFVATDEDGFYFATERN